MAACWISYNIYRLALGILRGKGISLLGNEDKPISRGYVLPDQPEFLVIFYKLFQLRETHWIRNAWPYLGRVLQESIVMIIKAMNTHKLPSIFP